jgi:hypothetical protein
MSGKIFGIWDQENNEKNLNSIASEFITPNFLRKNKLKTVKENFANLPYP